MNKQYQEVYNEAKRAYRADSRHQYMTMIEFIMTYIDDRFIEEGVTKGLGLGDNG